MTYFTTPDIQAHFREHLPARPQATNDFERFGLYRHTPEEALTCRYIQPDRPYQAAWLKLDVDLSHAGARWIDEHLPRPHLLIGNPKNGRAHYLYGLQAPIITSLNARPAPLKFLSEVEAGFTRLLGADPAYTGHTCKTPFHSSWYTHVYEGPLYALQTLADALPPSVSRRPVPRAELVGISRHLDLFDALRFWAYGEARAAKQTGSYERWQQAASEHAHSLNRFDSPLPTSSVRSIAKNVARWCWQHADTLNGSRIGGVKRSALKSWQREALTEAQQQERRREGQSYTSAVRRTRTFEAITSAIATLAGQGIHSPTQQQISQAAGVSLSTVERFSREQRRSGQGN